MKKAKLGPIPIIVLITDDPNTVMIAEKNLEIPKKDNSISFNTYNKIQEFDAGNLVFFRRSYIMVGDNIELLLEDPLVLAKLKSNSQSALNRGARIVYTDITEESLTDINLPVSHIPPFSRLV